MNPNILGLCIAALSLSTAPTRADFTVSTENGRIEIKDDQQLVFGWQQSPIKNPVGGKKFTGSAFIHPLCTPSGFQLTRIQPDDHKHHFGVWWPWKHLKVADKKYNTWEVQQGQGRHVGVTAIVKSKSPDEVVLKLTNQSEIKSSDSTYHPVISEHTTLRFSRLGKDAYVVDIDIQQQPVKDKKVIVSQYRYSGFSWRGTSAWNKKNSEMHTSGGQNRDTANGQNAHWAMVYGSTLKNHGMATMLIMSGATKKEGPVNAPEQLRVWDSKAHNGAPFINFNPVMQKSITMEKGKTPITSRRYRLILADHAITPTKANQLWSTWTK